jgi:VWFA-related protein
VGFALAGSPQEPKFDQLSPTVRVDVDVVNLFFNVKDKRGSLVPNLDKENFSILEDGRPQTIKYFSREADLPLTLGLLIDSSGSQQAVLGDEKVIGSTFLTEVLRPEDVAFVVSFDTNVTLLQNLTASLADLRAALNRATIHDGTHIVVSYSRGPAPSVQPRGTLLYDAVYWTAQEVMSKETGRKAIIVLTDGMDEGSRINLRDAVAAAQKADVIVYAILIADPAYYGGSGYPGEHATKLLVENTGGRVVIVGNKHQNLENAFAQIALELRNQYSIGYTSTNSVRDGSYRRLQLRAERGFKTFVRRGYYAPVDKRSAGN